MSNVDWQTLFLQMQMVFAPKEEDTVSQRNVVPTNILCLILVTPPDMCAVSINQTVNGNRNKEVGCVHYVILDTVFLMRKVFSINSCVQSAVQDSHFSLLSVIGLFM